MLERLKKRNEKEYGLCLAIFPNLVDDYNAWRLVAITDFIYNLGQGAYKNSTLRKRVNEEQWDLAEVEIKRWNKADGNPGFGGSCLPKDVKAYNFIFEDTLTDFIIKYNIF